MKGCIVLSDQWRVRPYDHANGFWNVAAAN
jgi:hypothetical protein